MLKKISIIAGTFLLALVAVRTADAAVMKNAYMRPDNPVSGANGVTHRFNFYHTTTSIGRIVFTYCENASGNCVDSGATLANAEIAAITLDAGDELANWTATGNDANETITLVRNSALVGTADGVWDIQLDTIKNPTIEACDNGQSTGTCYIRIQSYTDTAGTIAADQTTVSITVTQAVTVSATVDPSFTLTVAGVAGTTDLTAQGWAASDLDDAITTTVNTIPFGNLTPGTVKYAAHLLTISTNASNGYSVTARMLANMTGSAYGSDIDPLGNGAAVNTTSVAWASPTGTASGTDSGWLGIGTDDAGVTAAADNQFFPLASTVPGQTVVNSGSSANNDQNYVIYAIEVNNFQRADSYTGTMRFNALPVY